MKSDGLLLILSRWKFPAVSYKSSRPVERSLLVMIETGAAEDIMRSHPCLLALILMLPPVTAAAEPSNWVRYAIPETGASADIPSSIFSRDAGKPDDGYGARFLTSDGRADLTVQSVRNESGLTPAAFLARKNPPAGIVYKRVTPRFFVVSSVRQGKIWYNRCNFAGRFANCVLINYPAAEKRQWDSVVTRISNTLS